MLSADAQFSGNVRPIFNRIFRCNWTVLSDKDGLNLALLSNGIALVASRQFSELWRRMFAPTTGTHQLEGHTVPVLIRLDVFLNATTCILRFELGTVPMYWNIVWWHCTGIDHTMLFLFIWHKSSLAGSFKGETLKALYRNTLKHLI